MNLLCLYDNTVANKVLKEVSFDNYYMITPNKLELKMPNVFNYIHLKFRRGEIFSEIDWNKIPPLSKDLIESMSTCESVVLKMIEREKKIPAEHEGRKKYYLDHLRYWNHFLDAKQINVFFRSRPPHEGYDYIIYYLCKKKNIYTITLDVVHPGMAYLTTDIKNSLNLEKESEIHLGVKRFTDEHWDKGEITTPAPALKGSLRKQKKRLVSHKEALDYYKSKCVNPDAKEYIYFPLHYQPEATTSPLAGPFVDQHLIAIILSQIGSTVYIKEHPRISDNRNKEYYKRLLSLPNIKFVNEDTYKLIDGSVAVATATGSAGWEAVLRGKPVLMFGNQYYQYAPGVYQVGSLKECKNAIVEVQSFVPNKEEIDKFLRKLSSHLFEHTAENVVQRFGKMIEQYRGSEQM